MVNYVHSEMIRDHIVMKLLNDELSKKIQLDPNLTLEKAFSVAHQRKAVQCERYIP